AGGQVEQPSAVKSSTSTGLRPESVAVGCGCAVAWGCGLGCVCAFAGNARTAEIAVAARPAKNILIVVARKCLILNPPFASSRRAESRVSIRFLNFATM